MAGDAPASERSESARSHERGRYRFRCAQSAAVHRTHRPDRFRPTRPSSAITTGTPALTSPDEQTPAVSVAKSITPNYLICLEDGLKFKSMRRHLTLLGMTPDQYRRKWKLPANYPMVAPNYAAKRSTLAKNSDLGGGRGAPQRPPKAPGGPNPDAANQKRPRVDAVGRGSPHASVFTFSGWENRVAGRGPSRLEATQGARSSANQVAIWLVS